LRNKRKTVLKKPTKADEIVEQTLQPTDQGMRYTNQLVTTIADCFKLKPW